MHLDVIASPDWNESRDVLFEFHLKFCNTNSIGTPVGSLSTLYIVDF